MVFAADGDQVVDIGSAIVSVPFSDVVKFATVHRSSALEATAVPDSHGESLGGIGEALAAAQPEGTAGPVEDHPVQLRVRCQGLENLAGDGTDPDHLDMILGLVPSNTSTAHGSATCQGVGCPRKRATMSGSWHTPRMRRVVPLPVGRISPRLSPSDVPFPDGTGEDFANRGLVAETCRTDCKALDSLVKPVIGLDVDQVAALFTEWWHDREEVWNWITGLATEELGLV